MAKTLRGNRINKIMYISIGSIIAAIILFITLFMFFGKDNNSEDIKFAQEQNQNKKVSEEASSSLGKTVNEVNNSENGEDVQTLQVKIEEANNTEVEISEISDNIEQNNLQVEEANSEIANNVSNSTNSENTEETQEVEITEENQEKVEEEPKDPVFSMPVQGEIAKHYGKEKLIYSDTLKEWTTHLGIDIKADKTTIVKASADGCVKSIKNDPRYGLTVVIEHENGFTSIYSNLLTAEFVVVGENVKSGQTIGTVGNSATFEILDEPHLHFEILKDGNSIDPEMYIK